MDISGLNIDFNYRDNWVGIIGTRNPTEDEIQATQRLVEYLVSKNYVIVSGLAKGIDTIAHQSAILNGGFTIAVVSTSKKEKIYPSENNALSEEIKLKGCIIHPFKNRPIQNEWGFKGMNQFKRRLIERDLILAKLCNKIVAISDSETINGGTRWAVSYGQKLGKEVYRYDSKGIFHVNPPTSVCDLTWNMEFDMSAI